MKLFRKKLNNSVALILIVMLCLLSGCFTYKAKADTIEVDETSIPKEVTIEDFNLSDIKIIVHKIDGEDEIISVTKDMLSEQALEKLTKSGTHYIYIRYNGRLALATITLLDKYPNVLISFNSNGGSSVKRQVVEKNSLALKPLDPTRNGYKFTGWYLDEALTIPFSFSEKVEKNTVLYAGWEAIENIIKYETSGGTKIKDGVFVTGETLVLPTSPTKEGYTFGGWYTDSLCTNKYIEGVVSSSFTLYACWIAQECTIVFETNGGSEIGSTIVLYDNKLVEPKTPSRYGYFLEGWYTDKEFTNRYDFDSVIKGNLTLYANWIEATYTVQFETNGGTILSDIVVSHDQFLPQSATSTKENYRFVGWYLDIDLTIPFDQTIGITSNLILYAKWEGIVCQIEFNTDGGSSISTINVNYGNTATKPQSPSKEGYIFAGWYMDSELTKSFNFGTVIREDYTLYAKWIVDSTIKPKYTVTLFDGYFNVFKTFEVHEGDLLTDLTPPTMEGLAFEGWYLDQSFEAKYDLSIPVTIDLNLYSYFVETYVVTFLNKEGNIIAVQEIMGGYDAVYIEAPKVDGYDFIGWSHSLKKVSESFTAHPLYDVHKYTITFMVNDTVISTQRIASGEAAIEPPNMNEHATTGYHFAGWDKPVTIINSDQVYTAKFEKNIYTVEFVDYFGKPYETVKYQHGETIGRPDFDGDNYVQVIGWYTDNTFQTRYQFGQEIGTNIKVYGRFDFVGEITYVTNGNEITITNLSLRNIVNADVPNYLNDKIVTKVEKISNYSKVKSITINSNLTSIDISELSNITTLEVINVKNNGVYSSSNGVLYKGNAILLYPASKVGSDFTCASSEVGEYAFRNNQNIARLTLTNVTNIKANAFNGSNITHVSLLTSSNKAQDAFIGINENLVILVPNSKYGEYTTNWSDIASHIYSDSSVSSDFLYKETSEIVEIVEYLGTDSVIIVPNKINTKDVKVIRPYAFNSISSIKGIIVNENVSEICDNAFNKLDLDYLIIRGEVTINESYLSTLKPMLSDTNVYLKDSEYNNYSFTKQYKLSSINGDYSYIEEGGKWGILEYFGNATVITLPEEFNSHAIEFLKKGALSGALEKITINNDLVIEDKAISDEVLVLVNDNYYNEYKESYPTLRIYPASMTILSNSDYVYGVIDQEAVIISITSSNEEITIPNTLGGYQVTSIGKYALANNDKVSMIHVGSFVEFIDLYALRSKDSSKALSIIFSKSVAPEVGGEICYPSDKIFKEDENQREYGVRFPNHTVSVYNATVFENESYRYSVFGKFITILKYLGSEKEVTIPSYINGYQVIRVASYAFSGKNVERISVPSSIEYLEYLAFGGASNLEEVVIEGLKVIELESLLTNNSAVIRVSGSIIHRYQLNKNWKGEEIVTWDKEIVNYGDIKYYVSDNEAIIVNIIENYNKLTLPSEINGYKVVRLAPYALYETKILNLTLSSGITKIGYNALPKNLETLIIKNMDAPILEDQCSNFTVSITDSYIQTISSGYDKFTVIGMSEKNGEIDDFRYVILDNEATITKYLGNSQSVEIPQTIQGATVRVIGEGAFKDNTTLREVTFASTLREIKANAFSGCTNLETVNLGGGLTNIGLDAFTNTKYIKNNTDKFIIIDKVLYLYQRYYDATGEVTITSPIVSIAPHAFYLETSLTSIVIPNSVSLIGFEAFRGCSNLTSIVFPNSVKVIDSYAFSDCTRLRSIEFGSRLEKIGDHAFSGCTNLTQTNLSELSALEEISSYAFSGCSSITEVNLPSSIEVLGNEIFNMCTNLDEVVLNNDKYIISNGVLYNRDKTIVICDLLKNKERTISLDRAVSVIYEDAFNGSLVNKLIINSNALLLKDAIKNNNKLTALVFMGKELPKISLESVDTTAPIYILNSLLKDASSDEVLTKHIVRGVISYSFDTYTITIGSEFTIKPIIPIEVGSSDVTYRSMDGSILTLKDGVYVGQSVGTVKFIAYLNLDEVQSVEITINVVR